MSFSTGYPQPVENSHGKEKMAVITPQTDVYLLKVPLEINDINQLTFSNANAQFIYFNSLPKLSVDNFTYQRKDGVIRFGAPYDDLITYNYVMYRNEGYSNKWFYAYITNMEYMNNNTTDISIKTDVWQTWQFDLTYKPVLIDREHANTDVAGDNTLPEGLELGEMVANGTVTQFGDASNYCTIIEVSQIDNEGDSQTLSYEWEGETTYNITPILNDIPRGTTPLIVGTSTATASLPEVRKAYDIAGLADSIVNVYMLPTSLISTTHNISLYANSGNTSYSVFHVGIPEFKTGVFTLATTSFTKPTTVDGFTPKNKKVLSYPYCYFNISNNAGTSLPYHYEDFSSTVQFKTEGTFGVSGSTKTIPLNYKRIPDTQNALDFSVTGAKFPICSWKSDSYTNWLTQNAVNMETQWKTTILGGLLGVGTGAYHGYTAGKEANLSVGKLTTAGALTGGISLAGDMISLAREQHMAKTQANMVPDQVHGNLGAGDFVWAKYRSPFTYMPMSIKAEYARCIDEFFSQYGYKCNRVKVPNITGRRNWNYVKTVGCYIQADIPQDDLQEIKVMFDKGVTFWHNPSTFGDYSQNNDII